MKHVFLRRLAMPLVILLSFSELAEGQAIRAMYSFSRKETVEDSLSIHEPAMCLDYDGKRAVYYSESNFHRDSLEVLAFDENGDIANYEAYNKIYDYRLGTKDVVFVNYADRTFSLDYHLGIAFLNSTEEKLLMPEWTLTDEANTTKSGFPVKKAFAEYMGRKWTVWYCPDIPVSAGPWLFWGLPGLVAKAEDSERIFRFNLLYVESINHTGRYDQIYRFKHDYSDPHIKHYSYSVAKIEAMHNRAIRDLKYLENTLWGLHSEHVSIDKNGNRIPEITGRKYIPLIPDNWWK